MTADERQPRRRSVYADRAPAPRREGRRVAEADEDGQLRWAEDWRARLTGWRPLEEFLRGLR